mgnify:CR=1 FL=1|tara:strand:- start:5441 stop:5923 length:483 start_codon:yes stop_codon:yes gene_type:complete
MRREDIIAKIKDLKIPEFENNPELLASIIKKMEAEAEKQAEEDVDLFRELAKDRIQRLDQVPIPLTKDESRSFNQRMEKVLMKMDETEAKINSTIQQVKVRIDKKDSNLNVNISKNLRLKKAMKNIFGKKSDTITYSNYLELIELRKESLRKEKESFKVK